MKKTKKRGEAIHVFAEDGGEECDEEVDCQIGINRETSLRERELVR